jgi:2-polyprenyl-3-methyl-5-hydroxy-6-metoxy-1,4-benzoquinol methylase
MKMDRTYLSIGDFVDLFYKIGQKDYFKTLSKLHLSNKARTVSRWNTINSSSDFWIIPDIRRRWNEKCTGNPDLEYEDYTVIKYLSGLKNLKLLSVGCGTGNRERKFAKYPVFSLIEGIDIAAKLIDEAKYIANENNFNNIKYHAGDFTQHNFESESYDVILFNSSLHHFNKIDNFLKSKVFPLLKNNGYLVVFDYVGPNRLQWTSLQLQKANKILKEIPVQYRQRLKSNSAKRKIYRPGLLRMSLIDPSEAIDSESILPSLNKHFKTSEEKKIGWDLTHLILKDISHNFLKKDIETQKILSYIFEQEDKYLNETGRSDAIFGIYQKKL